MPDERELFIQPLYQDYFGKLKAIAYSKYRDLSISEDLVQETFLVATEHYEELREHENPFAYLKAVLNNKVKEYVRKRSQYRNLFISVEPYIMAQIPAPSNSSPISVYMILKTTNEVLTADEWEIFWSFTIDGASHLQIAKKQNISVNASQKRLERIRKKLEEVLPDRKS